MPASSRDSRIEHQEGADGGAFYLEQDGRRVGELAYRMDGGMADLHHTEVDESLRGKGAGARLVEAAVQWARAAHVKLLPTCPYARAVFDKTPRYADVRASRHGVSP